MEIPKRLIDCLNENKAHHEILHHPEAVTAQRIAEAEHVKGRAMPPFGNLYNLPTYVDKQLAEQEYIVFEAGMHTDTIKMSYRNYEKIVKPNVDDLAIKSGSSRTMRGA